MPYQTSPYPLEELQMQSATLQSPPRAQPEAPADEYAYAVHLEQAFADPGFRALAFANARFRDTAARILLLYRARQDLAALNSWQQPMSVAQPAVQLGAQQR